MFSNELKINIVCW